MTNSFIFMHSWVNVAVVHNVSCIFLPYMQLPRYFLAFPLNDFPRDLDLQILFFFHVSSRERGQMWHFDIAHIPFDIFRQFVTKPDHYQEFLLKADWLSFIHIVWKVTRNVAFWILAFTINFCQITIDLSGNTVWLQDLGYQKLAKIDHFWHFLLTFVSQNVAFEVRILAFSINFCSIIYLVTLFDCNL